jgi:tellurite resistance protein TehA-like permease
MASRKRGVLWGALIVALIAVAAQIAVLVMVWSRFDIRVLFVWLAVAAWAVAGIVGTLGRFLPRYIPSIFLGGIAIALVLFLIAFWYEWFRSRTMSFSDVLYFTFNAGLFLMFALGPSVSAWLLAFHERKDRAQPQVPTVFE